jgi:hypothetical protein
MAGEPRQFDRVRGTALAKTGRIGAATIHTEDHCSAGEGAFNFRSWYRLQGHLSVTPVALNRIYRVLYIAYHMPRVDGGMTR